MRRHDHVIRGSNPLAGCNLQEEGEGFEPSVDHKAHNGFRDRPVQPLRHPSELVQSVAILGRLPMSRRREAALAGPAPKNCLSDQVRRATK